MTGFACAKPHVHLELVKVSVSLLLAVQGDSRQVQSEIRQQFTEAGVCRMLTCIAMRAYVSETEVRGACALSWGLAMLAMSSAYSTGEYSLAVGSAAVRSFVLC